MSDDIRMVYNDGLAPGWRSTSFGCLDCNYCDTVQVRVFVRVFSGAYQAFDNIVEADCHLSETSLQHH